METISPDGLQQLAETVRARRLHLGLPVSAVAAAGRISKETVAKIEKGRAVRAVLYAKVETALGWAPGSVRAILDGGELTLAPPGRTPGRIDAVDLGQALTSAIVAVADRLTAGQIREISRLTVAELDRRGLVESPDEGGST